MGLAIDTCLTTACRYLHVAPDWPGHCGQREAPAEHVRASGLSRRQQGFATPRVRREVHSAHRRLGSVPNWLQLGPGRTTSAGIACKWCSVDRRCTAEVSGTIRLSSARRASAATGRHADRAADPSAPRLTRSALDVPHGLVVAGVRGLRLFGHRRRHNRLCASFVGSGNPCGGVCGPAFVVEAAHRQSSMRSPVPNPVATPRSEQRRRRGTR